MKKLVVITGPTAVGKTSLCLNIARLYNIPVINADSRQIYKEMKIGTAAPTEEEQRAAFHYFVNTLELDAYYNASMYEQDVLNLLSNELFKKSDIALMSGGSMMYIDAVCNGIDDIPTVDEEVRTLLKQRLESEGLLRLNEELKLLDPEYYAIVDLHNTRRVIHALEICYSTGNTYTSYRVSERKKRDFEVIKIGLTRPREDIYSRINRRVDKMIECGLIEEAQKLYANRHLNSLNTVGYKELFDFIDGKTSLSDSIEKIKSNTRRYSRKQLTWFKKDEQVKWFNPDCQTEILNFLSEKINKK